MNYIDLSEKDTGFHQLTQPAKGTGRSDKMDQAHREHLSVLVLVVVL